MLFNGEAIFGVLDLGGEEAGTRCRVERFARRARRLNADVQSQTVGAAVLGWAGRKAGCLRRSGQSRDSKIHAAVLGEIFSPRGGHELFCGGRVDCDWVAEGYRNGGVDFLAQLDGTFALALWDSEARVLVLLTDRRSDAQLFYRMDGNHLSFSSWLSLLAEPDLGYDRAAVHEFLRFLYIAPPRTIYKETFRIEPGCYLEVLDGKAGTHFFERDDDCSSPWDGSADEALDRFQDIFENAIARRIGRRRVGVFLSSGVDSATLLAGCCRSNPGNVEAFTVGFDDTGLDETSTARAYARYLEVPHTVFKFGLKEYRCAFEDVAREFDQPFADPAGLPLVLATAASKDRVDVISGGTGGDDLFGAPIPRHLRFSLNYAAKLPVGLRLALARVVRKARGGISDYASLFDFGDPEELLVTWSGWRRSELENLLGQDIDFADSAFYRRFRRYRDEGVQVLYDALGIFPPDDCRFEAAGPAGIPIELPYHDVDLHAFVEKLPMKLRMCDDITKVLLKNLFERYFPENLRLAKKHYFNMPLNELLANDHFELLRTHLTKEELLHHGCVDYEAASPWIRRFMAGESKLAFKIWALLVLHAWLGWRN